jgi:hypothetical protein
MKTIVTLLIYSILQTAAFSEYIGIRRADFQQHHRDQKGLMTCWASCAEMILSYEGINLPEESIVRRVRGIQVDGAGNLTEMVRSTNGIFTDTHGRTAVVSGQFILGEPLKTVLYNHLKRNKPVILTYQSGPWAGHAVVLVGIDATITPQDVFISEFHIFDPFCFQQTMGPYGPILVRNPDLAYRVYHPRRINPKQVAIEPGVITGVILVEGSTPTTEPNPPANSGGWAP